MSTAIDTITVGGVEDRRLVLSNSQIARIISVGTNWTTIRVGLRYCVQDTGGNYAGTPRLYIGMISSPLADMSNGPLTAATSHFVGFISNAANLARIAGPPAYYTFNIDTNYGKKIGATITSTAGTNQNHYIASNAGPRRSVSMVQLTKGAPNFTMTQLAPSPGFGPGDVALVASFKGAMSAATMGDAAAILQAATGISYTGTYTANVPVDEGANGSLNAICVAWDQAGLLYISDIAWAKIA